MTRAVMCAVSFQLQNFRRVYCKFLLFKLRQCEDYSEQSKSGYFEPLTFAWQRCLLQREHFDFFSTFSSSIFTLFAYGFIIHVITV